MKKLQGTKSILAIIVLALAISIVFTACGSSSAPTSSAGGSVSGSITSAGSTALQPLVEKASQQFMTKNPDAKVLVQGGGSGTGLSQVSQGAINIGNSDLFAEDKLKDEAKALVDHKVCVVGFATVVNPKVKVTNLTQQQLIDVFTGKITNWKDAGGDDMPIVIINRPASSGTRATFQKYALKGASEAQGKALTEDSSGTVKKAVVETDGSISYLGFPYLDNTINVVKLDGIDPTIDNVESGKYPIWSYEHMYTKGEATGLAKAFLDYMMGDEVQKQFIPDLKYIPITDMKTSR